MANINALRFFQGLTETGLALGREQREARLADLKDALAREEAAQRQRDREAFKTLYGGGATPTPSAQPATRQQAAGVQEAAIASSMAGDDLIHSTVEDFNRQAQDKAGVTDVLGQIKSAMTLPKSARDVALDNLNNTLVKNGGPGIHPTVMKALKSGDPDLIPYLDAATGQAVASGATTGDVTGALSDPNRFIETVSGVKQDADIIKTSGESSYMESNRPKFLEAQSQSLINKINTLDERIGQAAQMGASQEVLEQGVKLRNQYVTQLQELQQQLGKFTPQAPRSAQLQQQILEVIRAQQQLTPYQAGTLAIREREASRPEALVQIHDPESPTGTRFVTREEAVGKAGVNRGMKFTVDKDGRVTLQQGVISPDQGTMPLTPTVATDVQKDIIKTQNKISRLENIKRSFDSEYQTILPRVKNLFSSAKAKAGLPLSKEDTQSLTKFQRLRTLAGENLSMTINELSGAAVTEGEARRLLSFLPNAGTGVLDGDDPVTFQSKMDTLIESLKAAQIRQKIMLKEGIPLEQAETRLPLPTDGGTFEQKEVKGKKYVRIGDKIYQED